MSYAELLCVSNFTFQQGASHPFELVKRASELGYTALALTDECSLAGIVRAHEVAREVKLHLIVGSQFKLPDGIRIACSPPPTLPIRNCAVSSRARVVPRPRDTMSSSATISRRASSNASACW